MPELEIRFAKARDAETLARHRCEMFTDMGVLASDAYEELRTASARYFEQAIPSGRYVGWLACVGEQIVAGAGMQLNEILPRWGPGGGVLRAGPQGLIMNLYVEKEWRRRGVARTLMKRVIDFARKTGIPSLNLHASDEGRALYESLGFEATNEMRLFL